MFTKDIDEFTGYANGDGTFRIEIQTWVTNKNGKRERAQFIIGRAVLEEIALSHNISGSPTISVRVEGYC